MIFCWLQVIVVAFKNRKLSVTEAHEELYEMSDKDATVEKIVHTKQMRWLSNLLWFRKIDVYQVAYIHKTKTNNCLQND
jgi:hypothetical protein